MEGVLDETRTFSAARTITSALANWPFLIWMTRCVACKAKQQKKSRRNLSLPDESPAASETVYSVTRATAEKLVEIRNHIAPGNL